MPNRRLGKAVLREEGFELRRVDVRELDTGAIQRVVRILTLFDKHPDHACLARQRTRIAWQLEAHGAIGSNGAR